MAVVLLTTAYQSYHAFSHGHSVVHNTHSHELKKSNKQFSAADAGHEHEEDCSVCDFHFDFFVTPPQFCLRLEFPFKPIPYSFKIIEGNTAFTGSLFALRAPPVLV